MPKISRNEAMVKIADAARMNGFERALAVVAPGVALRRAQSRAALALTGAYVGGSRTRTSLKEWVTSAGDADTDLLWDLPKLIERSRDLERNDPLAHGAILTKGINIIGAGLKYRPQIDRHVLGMEEAEADALEEQAKREWKLFWMTPDVDAARTCMGPELEWMSYKQCKVNGAAVVLFPRKERPGSPYSTMIQIVEVDRLKNKDNAPDSDELSGGVRKDANGAPVEYHILKQHPGKLIGAKKYEWSTIPAYGSKTGLRNVLHIYRMDRPGQSAGIPDLTPVIESIKQISRYSEAEIEAAVLAAFFTVFVKSTDVEGGTGIVLKKNSALPGSDSASTDEYRLGKGSIVGLGPNEDISTANPGRPNSNYDPFFQSIAQLIGTALGMPSEILLKRFLASYSASRAALLEFWKYCIFEREWWALRFNQAILEMFWHEAVSLGRLAAPGFFDDPLIRQAYLGADWIGPARGMIDETKEVEAARERIALTISTHDEETAQLTGGDWEAKLPQLAKEKKMKQAAGLDAEKNEADAAKAEADAAAEQQRRRDDERAENEELEERSRKREEELV